MEGNDKRPVGRPRRQNAKRVNIRIDDEVHEYLRRTGNISATIERLVRDEMDNLLAIANAMYRELSGADNKQEKAQLVDEIYNWLREGDNQHYTMEDVPALVAEWHEYSGE